MSRRRASKNSELLSETAAAAHRDFSKAELLSSIEGQIAKLLSAPLTTALYLVSTPIGNLADMTVRALFTLAAADFVYCEDTRHSRKLFSAYGIGRKLEAYHDFSGERDRERVMMALRSGKSVALISDAGTPLIADPGFKLVRAVIAEGIPVIPVPGASAVVAALCAAGLPSDQFFFGGFLPPKEKARREALNALRSVPGTLVFYETPGRIEAALSALTSIFPDRIIIIARELTKLHEAFARGTAVELLEQIKETPPLGEIVLLIGPGENQPATDADIETALRKALKRGSLKEAVEDVAKGLLAGRKKVYNLALKLKKEQS
jgi:16S rRNA (cytidine1402-2'-O)-methyltransferase